MNIKLQNSDYFTLASAASSEGKHGRSPFTCVTANNVSIRAETPVIPNALPFLWHEVKALTTQPNPAESI